MDATTKPQPRPDACKLRHGRPHEWQPGPVVVWIEEGNLDERGHSRREAQALVLVCACGALLRVHVPSRMTQLVVQPLPDG